MNKLTLDGVTSFASLCRGLITVNQTTYGDSPRLQAPTTVDAWINTRFADRTGTPFLNPQIGADLEYTIQNPQTAFSDISSFIFNRAGSNLSSASSSRPGGFIHTHSIYMYLPYRGSYYFDIFHSHMYFPNTQERWTGYIPAIDDSLNKRHRHSGHHMATSTLHTTLQTHTLNRQPFFHDT